ncbi:MAG: 4-alpha-glucanotransferase [Anaeromyxobacteraceae bacterium]
MSAPPRVAGVLLHPTSLPGPHGVGDLGPAARRFIDWLADAGQALWQVLPLTPTGYGDSPYAALSAFAGNPLLVSLEDLAAEGLLDDADLAAAPRFPASAVDYAAVAPWKGALLARTAERFLARAPAEARRDLDAFREREAPWLHDLALFLALKARHGGRSWVEWEPALARRDPAALERAHRQHEAEVRAHVFAQWAFDRQWARLRAHARARGVRVMGDLPIYLAHDSAEVWARPELFQLDRAGRPRAVAGVPPDFFAKTGQLWGNPIYDWERQARDGFAFWVERLRANLRLFDLVRLDHFRGFEGYWEVPAGAATAEGGRWVKGPGAALFDALRRALGALPLVAENLGVITPEVEALRRRFGLPGMAVLQFAFGTDPQADTFKPHDYDKDLVVYTGTHDNDTVLGWWANPAGATSTPAEVEAERAHARAYLAADGREMNWTLVRWAYASVARTAIAPLQDLLGLGSEARMNLPGTASGNWRWRLEAGAVTPALARRVRDLARLYGRSAGSVSSNQ